MNRVGQIIGTAERSQIAEGTEELDALLLLHGSLDGYLYWAPPTPSILVVTSSAPLSRLLTPRILMHHVVTGLLLAPPTLESL